MLLTHKGNHLLLMYSRSFCVLGVTSMARAALPSIKMELVKPTQSSMLFATVMEMELQIIGQVIID